MFECVKLLDYITVKHLKIFVSKRGGFKRTFDIWAKFNLAFISNSMPFKVIFYSFWGYL